MIDLGTIFSVAFGVFCIVLAILLATAYDKERKILGEKAKLQEDYDFLKETIATWTTKPVYALLSEEQLNHIGKAAAEHMKGPKSWLN